MEAIKVKRVGEHWMEGNLYQDSEGRYYVDCNDDEPKVLYRLCPSTSPEGEPNECIKHFEVENPFTEREKLEREHKLDYMMLGMLKNACESFLSVGTWHYKRPQTLCGQSIEGHIGQMREYWHLIPDSVKPEWLTLEQIDEYGLKMANLLAA